MALFSVGYLAGSKSGNQLYVNQTTPQPYHLVFVISNFKMGGAERQVLLLAKQLRSHTSLKITVFALSKTPGRVSEICEREKIPCAGFNFAGNRRFRRFIISLFQLTRFINALEPDILMPYTDLPNITAGLIWRFTRTKILIWNQRNGGAESGRLPWPFIEKLAALNSPFFCSNSMEGKTFLEQHFKISKEKIQVIRNGAILPIINKKDAFTREQFKIPKDAFVAGMLANIHHRKDHRTLLDAWKSVANKFHTLNRKCFLLLAGRAGDTYTELMNIIKNYKLTNSVLFVGEIKDVLGFYLSADVCVFSSKSSKNEGIPNAIIEAMAIGLPIVATDILGIREAVSEDNLEHLVEPGNANSLAEKIISVALSPEKYVKIGQKNKSHIEKYFSPEKLCLNTIQLLNSHLKSKGHTEISFSKPTLV